MWATPLLPSSAPPLPFALSARLYAYLCTRAPFYIFFCARNGFTSLISSLFSWVVGGGFFLLLAAYNRDTTRQVYTAVTTVLYEQLSNRRYDIVRYLRACTHRSIQYQSAAPGILPLRTAAVQDT